MIGLIITDYSGNVTTYNPHIANNQYHFDIESFQLGVELSASSIANQVNVYVSGLDLANVASIELNLNNNVVRYENPIPSIEE